jgi:hypothetical protein
MRLRDALFSTMRTLRIRRIGRAEAEQLLTGRPTVGDRSALAGLLAAAAAPARPDELAGEQAIRSAFARAQLSPDPAPVAVPERRRHAFRFGGMATVKVAAAVAALIAGGTAFAAETGNLPDAAQRRAHDLFSAWGVPAPESAGPSAGLASVSPSASPSAGRSPSPDASTSTLLALCRVWDAAERDPQAKALAADELRALLTAAGGAQSIPKFCAGLLGQHGNAPDVTPPPTPSPTHPGKGNGNGRPSPTKTHK